MNVAKSSSPHINATVTRFFEGLKDWDFDIIEEVFSEDFVHTTLPASTNEPPRDKKHGIEHAKAIAALLGNPHLDYKIIQWTEAADGSIWVHVRRLVIDRLHVIPVRASGEILGGRQFNSENIFIFKLNSEGDKIDSMQEFVDTVLRKEFDVPPQ